MKKKTIRPRFIKWARLKTRRQRSTTEMKRLNPKWITEPHELKQKIKVIVIREQTKRGQEKYGGVLLSLFATRRSTKNSLFIQQLQCWKSRNNTNCIFQTNLFQSNCKIKTIHIQIDVLIWNLKILTKIEKNKEVQNKDSKYCSKTEFHTKFKLTF